MAPPSERKKKPFSKVGPKQRRRRVRECLKSANLEHHASELRKQSEGTETKSSALVLKPSKEDQQPKVKSVKNEVTCFDSGKFSEKLKNWHFQHKITHNALSDLLKVLRSVEGLSYLPKSAVTFLETPTDFEVEQIIDGEYFYFGISDNVRKILLNVDIPEVIKLIMGFDGAPLTESGKKEFWPIMVGFLNIPLHKHTVFTAALYCSEVKLEVPEEIFKDFVPEVNKLKQLGLVINDQNVKVEMDAYCMDAPAKAKVLGIKSCGGFSSCSKCWVVGKTIGNRRSYLAQTCRLRTQDDWEDERDESLHVGPNCLLGIDGIDLSAQIVLDPMHLVCIGVVKKLFVDFWIEGKHKNKFAKLRASDISAISSRLKLLKTEKHLARDFSNYPRSLDFAHKWKATEFRTFLLYIGPVVLESILDTEAYEHFLRLHVAFTVLLSEILCVKENIDVADEQLHIFVDEFAGLYGNEYISHNVHGLIHTAKDAHRYGPLDNVSAFRFENHLGQLVKLVNKPGMEVKQVVRRVYERNQINFVAENRKAPKKGFALKHDRGPLCEGLSDPQYQLARLPKFTIGTCRQGDRCFLMQSGEVVAAVNFATATNGSKKVVGREFGSKTDFYLKPLPSSQLGIWQVAQLSNETNSYDVKDILLKMITPPQI